MTTPLTGASSNLTPDYTRETAQMQTRKGVSDGAPSSGKGAILAKDSLEVPYEMQAAIQAAEAEAGRPSLPPLFQTRFVNDRQGVDLSRDYYQALRENLPFLLKERLEKDEALSALADRDPDLVALDESLKFEAHLLALADTLSAPNGGDEIALLGIRRYSSLPAIVQQELSAYGSKISHFLDHYLSDIGSNNPGYEIYLNVSNQMKEALELLRLNRETTAA